MVPIFMLRESVSRSDRRNGALEGYLKAEFGSSDSGWVRAEADRMRSKSAVLEPRAKRRVSRIILDKLGSSSSMD